MIGQMSVPVHSLNSAILRRHSSILQKAAVCHRGLHSCIPRFSSAASEIVLRPYQEECVQSCLEALASGSTRIGVSSPTGSGKTTMFLSLLSRLPPPESRPRATRSLVIVNSIELAQQAAKQANVMLPALNVEIEQGKNVASGVADITVATYQTLLQEFRLMKFDPSMLKAVIVDEAHHAAAPSYRRVLTHFDPAISARVVLPEEDDLQSQSEEDHSGGKTDPIRDSTAVPIIGFSATFSRHDGMALGKVFQRIVYHRDFLQMIKEQWLCDVRFTSVKAKLDLKDVIVSSQTGDFSPTSLSHVINTPSINKLVMHTWLDRASERKSTLIFCVNLAHVQDLTNAFRNAGIDARLLHSGTATVERKALLDDFRAGEFPVLVNCAILIEGADIPNIDCVIITRPTRSRNMFAQMIGRGMRLSPSTGKTDCRIIDFVDSTSRVSGVVTVPTLFGLDPDDVANDESLEEIEARAKAAESVSERQSFSTIPAPKSVTYTDYDNPFELAQDASGSPHIHRLSRYAWVACGNDSYILECLGRGHIKVERLPPSPSEETSPGYQAWFTPARFDADEAMAAGGSPYRRKIRILTALDLNAAVKGCDTYATQKVVFGPLALGLFRSAKWRSMPATEGQRSFVGKRLFKAQEGTAEVVDPTSPGRRNDKELSMDTLTKGQAANIITRLKHGAEGHYKKKLQGRARVARLDDKESRRKAKHIVRVGPLLS